jgi:hypothetical protein
MEQMEHVWSLGWPYLMLIVGNAWVWYSDHSSVSDWFLLELFVDVATYMAFTLLWLRGKALFAPAGPLPHVCHLILCDACRSPSTPPSSRPPLLPPPPPAFSRLMRAPSSLATPSTSLPAPVSWNDFRGNPLMVAGLLCHVVYLVTAMTYNAMEQPDSQAQGSTRASYSLASMSEELLLFQYLHYILDRFDLPETAVVSVDGLVSPVELSRHKASPPAKSCAGAPGRKAYVLLAFVYITEMTTRTFRFGVGE